MSTRNTIILDIDGVLADYSARTPLIAEGLIDEFYRVVDTDRPIPGGVALAKMLESFSIYRIVYLTGRLERCREGTLAWLRKHICDCIDNDRLLMRPDYDVDYRGFKTSVVTPFKDDVLFVVDDDAHVVDEMHALGISVLHYRDPDLDLVTMWANRDSRGQVLSDKEEDCVGCAEKRRRKAAAVGR